MFLRLVPMSLVATTLFATPYFDPTQVPRDPDVDTQLNLRSPAEGWNNLETPPLSPSESIPAVRVTWKWKNEIYTLEEAVREPSGTPALLQRSQRKDPLGSYQAKLQCGDRIFYSSIGTGKEYRTLTRGISARFPFVGGDCLLTLEAENPMSGVQEQVFSQVIRLDQLPFIKNTGTAMRLKDATQDRHIKVVIYAEGYREGSESSFLKKAQLTAEKIAAIYGDLAAYLEINAVFQPSSQKIGAAKNLGFDKNGDIPARDSFLGLYFPYWSALERWYHVVYPTRESTLRRSFATVPYDYPIALVDDGEYWGVGNFNALTSIPASSPYFTFLLTHEFGHYLGLNEEYEGGGKTELEFARNIPEPWSQNITFLRNANQLKWRDLVQNGTKIPTPKPAITVNAPIGAYLGGYGDSAPGKTYKPGFSCVMERGAQFCNVCKRALKEKLMYDLGLEKL